MLNLKLQTQMKMEHDVPCKIPKEQLKKMKTKEELESYITAIILEDIKQWQQKL
jgi:hypothetical protein